MFNNQVSWTPDTSEKERNEILHEDPQFVRRSLMSAIVTRKISDTIFLSGLLHSFSKTQFNEIAQLLLHEDERNIHFYERKYRTQVTNHWHYAFLCDALGIDPSKIQ
jgi:hypothetical protein